ncbi:E3 ubiquitin-protein ligase RNF183 [Xenentodon cancila]
MNDDRERSLGAPLAPNVKPKPTQSQNDSSSKEDRRRKEKPAKVRRSRSTDSERTERGRRRERDRGQGTKSQRGRSEEARRQDRKGASYQRKKPPEDDVGETECAICFTSYNNVFKTPKLLACGHTFCLECLARINVTSAELKTLTCPLCRKLTKLPHGRDLPRLGNNQEIIDKLPADMQRALSVRFKRSKGKLVLKNPPPSIPTKPSILSVQRKSPDVQVTAGIEANLEQGVTPTTVVDVGRPPNRMRGRLRRVFRSDPCYYVVVAAVITITVALMLVGILAFVLVPTIHHQPVRPENQTLSLPPVGGSQVTAGTTP